MKKHIPNTLTLLNLFCGSSALVALFHAQNVYVFWFIGISLIADLLDGAAARWLGVSTPMGRELDSLADLVSFGVLPAAVLYTLLAQPAAGPMTIPGFSLWHLPAFFVALCAALRLAKFNLDSRQSETFLGLPTPSTTLFAIGLLWIRHYQDPYLAPLANQQVALWASVAVLSLLMISEVPMFSLKIKSLRWKGNEMRAVFAAAIVVLVSIFGVAALSPIILTYIALNGAPYLINRLRSS